MARIAGVDLPRDKRVEIGLTYIYGIGRVSANRILTALSWFDVKTGSQHPVTEIIHIIHQLSMYVHRRHRHLEQRTVFYNCRQKR